MKFSFNIEVCSGRAFGFTSNEDFVKLKKGELTADRNAVNPKPKNIPMMTARRLSPGCRMAVDLGLELIKIHPDIDAVIYSSDTGEQEHNFKVLDALAQKMPCSPTDFSMSVHNTAVGNFTILSKLKIPSSSISAGADSFMMALSDAWSFLQTSYKKILLVDYCVQMPEFYSYYLDENYPKFPYATGFILSRGNDVTVETVSERHDLKFFEPLSLEFLINYLADNHSFSLNGQRLKWKISM
ncbi:MAG: beta-ketoacyl synthase chain length factor [Succinivibrio sp.]